jgi:ABC-2 type transport system permease protein
MNYSMVTRLIAKDWYLQRWMILASLAGGAASLGIVCTGGKAAFMLGLILLVMVLIFVGAQLPVAMMVHERKEQTLSFVMSLPISHREYTTGKILGTLLIFLIPWLVLVLGSLALFAVPNGVALGLLPYTVIMAIEILVGVCLTIAVALVTESQGWAVAAVMVGNVGFNIVGYYVAHLSGIAQGMWGSSLMWSPTASTVVLTEFAVIALLLCFTFFFQSRKRDFL